MFLASNKKRKSSDLEGTPNPKLGQKQNGGAKTPKSGLKFQSPKSGLKMQTPKANLKPGTPKSNQKKNIPKNGARKPLAVNGTPKVEKVTSNEENTAVKVEAVANSPANKNRKRSLSESGVESAAKTTKLEKFAGTASLTTDKKGQRNRSARRHEQFKEKKKTVSKDNKNKIKQKILAGDIEALREIKSKLDALLTKPAQDRTNSARRKIRKFQSWLSIKDKKGEASDKTTTKVQKQKPGQKKNQQKNKKELVKSGEQVSAGTKKTQKPAQKKNQQVIKKELELTEDASDESDEEISTGGLDDSEMQSAESDDLGEEGSDDDLGEDDSDEEGSDEEDSDIDEEDSNDEEVTSEFIVDQKGQKPNQKPAISKPQQRAQNKGKPFGKPGNNRFAARQKKGPQKK